MADTFVVSQKAAVKEGGRYLILRRSPHEDSSVNCWEFPGGRLEKEEEPLQGVEREVQEEAGLKVKAIRPLFAFKKLMPNTLYYVFLVYHCKKHSGSVRLSEEHTAHRWATREEILRLPLHPFLQAFLEQEGAAEI